MRFLLNKFVGLLFLIIILGSISGSIAALFGIQIQINYLRYAIVIALYIYILVLVWLDLEHLALFNLDRTTLVLIVVFGILRSRLDVKNEGFYKGVILVLALSILVACFKNWKNVPKTNWHWAAIGILACLSVIPLSFVESLQPEKYTNLNISSDRQPFEASCGAIYENLGGKRTKYSGDRQYFSGCYTCGKSEVRSHSFLLYLLAFLYIAY
jgi:hypothetical protein